MYALGFSSPFTVVADAFLGFERYNTSHHVSVGATRRTKTRSFLCVSQVTALESLSASMACERESEEWL
jgi:hypothetical protein